MRIIICLAICLLPTLALAVTTDENSERLISQADQHFKTGSYGEAEPLYQWALAITEKALGPNHLDTAAILYNLARLYFQTDRYGEAELPLKRALAISEKALGPDHPYNATGLNFLALLYFNTRRYGEAEPLFQRALAISENALGPDHPDIVSSLNFLAWLYREAGRYDEAEPPLKRALAISENALGPDHPGTADSLNNLAEMYVSTGRYGEAESLSKRALAIREKGLGPDHPQTAASLNNLAGLYETTGRYGEAEPLFQRALAINEKAIGPDHSNTAANLNNLAGLYETTGRYGEAEPLHQRALAISEKALGPDHPKTADSLNNLAHLYHTTGRYGEAEPLYQRALAINEKALGPDHPKTATILNNLAGLYDTTGRYGEAEPLYNRVLAIREKTLGLDHPDTAISINNLAGLYHETGRYGEAEPLYRKSLHIIAKSGEPLAYATILHNCASFLSKQHSPSAGILLAKQSVNILQGLRHNVSGITQKALKSFDKTIGGAYQHLASMLLDQGRLAEAQQVLAMLKEEEYFEFIQRDAGAANRLTNRASYLASEEPWIKEYEAISARNVRLGKELGELRTKAKYYPLEADEKRRLAKLTKEDEQTTAAFNDYLARLLKAMKEEASANADRVENIDAKQLKSLATLKSMLKNLGDGSVLLHYLITDERLHILLTTPDVQLARHSDIKAKDLNRKIFALRDALTNPRIDPRPVAKELYDLLIAPVAKDLQASQATTLMLSLDGALRYLPFSALHDGKSYVAQSYRTVMYVEVARDKVALPAMRKWKVAALGVSDKVHADFPPLPNVPAELNAIVSNSNGGIIPGEIRLNKYFTENAMTDSSHRNPVVHIASHFRFVPGSYRDSFLLLGDGSTLSLDRIRSSRFFQETELLTLSACETAMGSTGKGVEIEGFGAIAMNQGAKSVIATLWPVSDKSTALLMKEFYLLREEKKMSKVEALRQAQLMLLKGEIVEEKKEPVAEERGAERTRFVKDAQRPYSHPYYWAPFILMGNWK
jgi:CHAT domain-containing protein/Tfp pilus assembly protein PilF